MLFTRDRDAIYKHKKATLNFCYKAYIYLYLSAYNLLKKSSFVQKKKMLIRINCKTKNFSKKLYFTLNFLPYKVLKFYHILVIHFKVMTAEISAYN